MPTLTSIGQGVYSLPHGRRQTKRKTTRRNTSGNRQQFAEGFSVTSAGFSWRDRFGRSSDCFGLGEGPPNTGEPIQSSSCCAETCGRNEPGRRSGGGTMVQGALERSEVPDLHRGYLGFGTQLRSRTNEPDMATRPATDVSLRRFDLPRLWLHDLFQCDCDEVVASGSGIRSWHPQKIKFHATTCSAKAERCEA